MRLIKMNPAIIGGAAVIFIILANPSANFARADAEFGEDEKTACGPPLFGGVMKGRDTITMPIDASLKDALKEADRALAGMPGAKLLISTSKEKNESSDTVLHRYADLRRAEYLRELVTSGKAGTAIDPGKVKIFNAEYPSSSGTTVSFRICFPAGIKYIVTPKITEFPDASLSFGVRGAQEAIKAAVLKFFKELELSTREETTDAGVSIVTAYDYSEPKAGRRNKRASYLVQIPQPNRDGYCAVKLRYLIESRGDREKTWSVIEEDARAAPRQLKAIKERFDALANDAP